MLLIEQRIYAELIGFITHSLGALQRDAAVVARIDCLQSFARIARERNYVRPTLDDGTRIEAMAHGAKYVKKQIKPGDLDIFEGEKDLGDGVVLRMQRDRKYVEATLNYPFTMDKGETNALSAHVQNTYGMYDPRKPNWNAGENQLWVKEDPSAEWSMIEPYTQFSRFSLKSFFGKGTLSDEQWINDNKTAYEAFVNDPSDKNYKLFTGSNLVHFYLPNLYALW